MWCAFSFLSIIKIVIVDLQNDVDRWFDLGDRVSLVKLKHVGFGTYGVVYKGTLDSETEVAVKVIPYGDKSALPMLKVSSLCALSL